MSTKKDLAGLQKGLLNAFSNVKLARGMGAFVLAFCYIDWLTSYYFARDTTKVEYKSFIRRFLPNYDPDRIYDGARCGLVHNFTDRGSQPRFDFREDATKTHLQLRPVRGNPKEKLRVLNLSNLIADLETATREFFKVLDTNPELARRALARYKSAGLIAGAVETE